ncbi:hypothetical protein [uncultured Tenacibaculum sp.]|uniref:hypothetical protein n=1 Tax=uncultured Tenacibaculum sp. TaxID=174713 RepID=UPI00260B831E|nr:hypothetical protein [uncultured Tenacibaculum sp.]
MKILKNLTLLICLSILTISCNKEDEIVLENENLIETENLQSRNLTTSPLVVSNNFISDKLILEVNQEGICGSFGSTGGYSYSLTLYVQPGAKRNYSRQVNVWGFWNQNTGSLPGTWSFRIPANFSGPLKINTLIPNTTSVSYSSIKVQIQNVFKIEGFSHYLDNSSEWIDDIKTGMKTCIEQQELPCDLQFDCEDSNGDFGDPFSVQ